MMSCGDTPAVAYEDEVEEGVNVPWGRFRTSGRRLTTNNVSPKSVTLVDAFRRETQEYTNDYSLDNVAI